MEGYDGVVVTCEHGGNRVPPDYAKLFRSYRNLLATHRGWDSGALQLAREIADGLNCELVSATVTRLLVDLNRSLTNHRAFSEASRALNARQRADVVAKFYLPHRRCVESTVKALLNKGQSVLHLSVHSFTPVLNGRRRDADLGLLYDPARLRERAFSLRWQHLLREQMPWLIVRRNYPYRGNDDGLTTSLRSSIRKIGYLGIELEVNQRWVEGKAAHWRQLRTMIVQTLRCMRN